MTFLSTQPYKGTRDFYPAEMRTRNWIFRNIQTVVESYGYEEYGGPMLEPFDLYAAKTGQEIVNEQLYHLVDQGGRKLAVRPEMTPTMARMIAAQVMELPKPVRWYSIPNLWRYERPQRGRLREHWQLNVDFVGGDPLLADVEVLQVAFGLLEKFKGGQFAQARVNHRGLVDLFLKTELKLSDETSLQLIKLADARDKMGEEKFNQALSALGLNETVNERVLWFFAANFEEVAKVLKGPAIDHLKSFFKLIEQCGLGNFVRYDPSIMRGMDYYTGLVFEVFDTDPENRRALFGGGRYDNLIGLFGKTELSGIGFGMGDVGIQNFLETHQLLPVIQSGFDVGVVIFSQDLYPAAFKQAVALRAQGKKVLLPSDCSSIGHQLKALAKQGVETAYIFAPEEFGRGEIIEKNMATGEQRLITSH